jgi:exopolysaccharide biosynthesis predicted pyruvyltransferase EpsI
MSKLTLTFDMEQEAHEATQAVHASEAWDALEQIYQAVRSYEKHDSVPTDRLHSNIRETIMEAQQCLM